MVAPMKEANQNFAMPPKNPGGNVNIQLGPDKSRLDAVAKEKETKPTTLAREYVLAGIKADEKR